MAIESSLKIMKNDYFSCLFGHVGKRLGQKVRLISKFITSETGKQIIIFQILSNISRNKDNQAVNFTHLIENNLKIFFFKYYAENEEGSLVLDLFLFFKKALYTVETSGQHLSFKRFR